MSGNTMTLNEMARRYLELTDREEKWFAEHQPEKATTSNPYIISMMTEADDFESLGMATYGESTFMAEVLKLMAERGMKVA